MKQKVPFLVLKKALRRAGFFYALRIGTFCFSVFLLPIMFLNKTSKFSEFTSKWVIDGNMDGNIDGNMDGNMDGNIDEKIKQKQNKNKTKTEQKQN